MRKIKILFVCHGNICRSPMAEFVFKDMVKKKGLAGSFFIASAATSTEELGNPVHVGTRAVLGKLGISTEGKYAVQVKREDYRNYDYIIGMDSANIRNMNRIFGDDKDNKIWKMLEFAGMSRDVDDPWYTGKFEKTYEDILAGCKGLLEYIMNHDKDRL